MTDNDKTDRPDPDNGDPSFEVKGAPEPTRIGFATDTDTDTDTEIIAEAIEQAGYSIGSGLLAIARAIEGLPIKVVRNDG